MKRDILIVLDYSSSRLIKIKLTSEELKKSEQYSDFEEFISHELEKTYGFRLPDCSWMLTNALFKEQEYGF